jgi:hypothetical protein
MNISPRRKSQKTIFNTMTAIIIALLGGIILGLSLASLSL